MNCFFFLWMDLMIENMDGKFFLCIMCIDVFYYCLVLIFIIYFDLLRNMYLCYVRIKCCVFLSVMML